MTDHPSIESIGVSLYGEWWQRQLARDLGVSDRTVRYWIDGTMTPKPGVYADIARICRDRAALLTDLATKIEEDIQ